MEPLTERYSGYDSEGRYTLYEDRNGNYTGYVYDEKGNVLRTEYLGSTLLDITDDLSENYTYYKGSSRKLVETASD